MKTRAGELTRRHAIGLDLGGTTLKYGIADAEGCLVYQRCRSSDARCSRARARQVVMEAVGECLAVARAREWSLAGVGLGCPGTIDAVRGVSLGPTQYVAEWDGAPVGEWIRSMTRLPVHVDNDANVMALAETLCGAGRGCRRVVGVTLGTGVGGGLVFNGRLFHGAGWNAGEIGHVVVEAAGRACSCGNRGCLIQYCGTQALLRAAERYGDALPWTLTGHDDLDLASLLGAYHGRQIPVAESLVADMIAALARALRSVVYVVDPDIIVIGGGLSMAIDLVPTVARAIRERVMPTVGERLAVVRAELGNDAGLIGAALLCFGAHDLPGDGRAGPRQPVDYLA